MRLDEVLADVGDKPFYDYDYDYDFGDDWQHTIKLEAVLPRRDSGPVAVCVAGRRDGPAEDCGGVYAYELTCAATDPGEPGHIGGAPVRGDRDGGGAGGARDRLAGPAGGGADRGRAQAPRVSAQRLAACPIPLSRAS